jgi:hypothetical protein
VAAIQIKMKQSTLCGVNTRYNKDIYYQYNLFEMAQISKSYNCTYFLRMQLDGFP